jgi:TnpA family transposase
MAHRPILNDKQRNILLSLPTREHDLLQYYVLSNEDLSNINTKRKASNRLGFALQLCAFRYPGRLLQKKEVIPQSTLMFLAAQLGISDEDLETYGIRSETRYEHSSELQRIYGFRIFQDADEQSFLTWLTHTSRNEYTEQCRVIRVICTGMPDTKNYTTGDNDN